MFLENAGSKKEIAFIRPSFKNYCLINSQFIEW